METPSLFKTLYDYCSSLEQEFDHISSDRKEHLGLLSNYISEQYKAGKVPQLIVICTHNSRRSHMGQIWLAAAAEYYRLPPVQTFSGGTEATAFNPNAVKAMRTIGFSVEANDPDSNNPIYQVRWNDEMRPYAAFSTKYNDTPNPKENFAAIMVCTSADEACPFVPGADFRIALPFDDPKAFDNSPLKSQKYQERARQIGREMLYVMSQVSIPKS